MNTSRSSFVNPLRTIDLIHINFTRLQHTYNKYYAVMPKQQWEDGLQAVPFRLLQGLTTSLVLCSVVG